MITKNIFFGLIVGGALCCSCVSEAINSLDEEYVHLANDMKAKGKEEKAIAYYKKALEINPDNFKANFRLALDYYQNGNYEDALEKFKKASELRPNTPSIFLNLGAVLKCMGRFEESIKAHKAAMRMRPDYAAAHRSLGYIYLTLGELQKGWDEYNIAHKIQNGDDKKMYDLEDLSCLHGKTVLIRDEAGFGDVFCWIRYAKVLKDNGAKIVTELRKNLIPILSQCPYLDTIIEQGKPLPACDEEIYIGHLPWMTNTKMSNAPAEIPYLYADEKLVKKWAEKLSQDKTFKIGICWHPRTYRNPYTKKIYKNNRAMNLSYFYPLSKFKNVKLYNLQFGGGTNQLDDAPKDFVIHTFDGDFDKSNGRFMDTAAVIKNLDLVITIDTSTAHLAGALGVPVWVALPYVPDWRWFLESKKSIWYPTMRFFRQPKLDDWDTVMKDVVAALDKLLCDRDESCRSSKKKVADSTERSAQLYSDKDYVRIAEYYHNDGEEKKALEYAEKAVQLNPNNVDAYIFLIKKYYKLQEWDKALHSFKKLSLLYPNSANVFHNIGYISYHKKHDILGAIEAFKMAIKLNPDQLDSHYWLSRSYLPIEEFEKAWFRQGILDKIKIEKGKEEPIKKLWDGSDLNGKIILIRDDRGIGDVFNWLRYARDFKNQGAEVIAAVRECLMPLISLCPYIDKVVDCYRPLPAFDFQVTIGKAQSLLNHNMESLVTDIPYMYADQKLVKKWAEVLAQDNNFKIGICWDPCSTYVGAKTKSPVKNERAIPLQFFYPLGKLNGVSLYSLQQCNGTEQIGGMPDDFHMHIFDDNFDRMHGSFMDTAAVMKNLDLVITADTSVAHLAGALGVPVWTLLPFVPSWRWFLDRSDTQWYPTMRLFRQPKLDDWESAMEDVVCELVKILS